MFAYVLTAICVALAAFLIVSHATTRKHTWRWPMWVRLTAAVLIGALWPLLSLWALGHTLRTAALAAWRWALGDHNKLRRKPARTYVTLPFGTAKPGDSFSINAPKDGSVHVQGFGDLVPGERLVVVYDEGGKPRYDVARNA